MSGKSSPTDKSHPSSQSSGVKQQISSFSRSSHARPTSPLHSYLPEDNTGHLDTPSHHADTHLASVPVLHRTSPSSVSVPSIADPLPVQPLSTERPTHHLEDPASQNRSSTPLARSLAPQVLQGQASTSQGPTHAPGAFSEARDFTINHPVFNDYHTIADNFMKDLLRETIIGAEFDSSDRHPPPRCHPGTRLAIIQRCLDFIVQCKDGGKLRWVVGPAGVGKSAVVQMVTEKAPDGVIFASIFLSINGRADGNKVILTIACQLAAKCAPYRQFIRNQITLDPSVVRKSLSAQFNKFIIEPFILQRLFEPSYRFLIAIDGLDECDNPSTQKELLKLITDFCITHPTSPIAWIIASRPEPHITLFFERDEVKRAYSKEEIEVDSDGACEEVQKYLRDELKKIKLKYATLKDTREWPLEHEFTKIASSARGLFAYAAMVVRYIASPYYRDPAAQLHRVLEVIDAGTRDYMSGRDHPMAHLDALYTRILSHIPDDVMVNTRKLLLSYSSGGWPNGNFRWQCNVLGLTEDAAYEALRHLHAVMRIPNHSNADQQPLSYYHKLFEDFLFDFERSGFTNNIVDEVERLRVQSSLRIVGEVVPDDADRMAYSEPLKCGHHGYVKGDFGNISLSWPGNERFKMTDDELWIELYRNTVIDMCTYSHFCSNFYDSLSRFHVLSTHITVASEIFPFYDLRTLAFDQFRSQLTELGKLNQVPLRTLDYAAICGRVHLLYTSPIGIDFELNRSWNPSCNHRKGVVGGLPCSRDWSTVFERYQGVAAEEDTDIPRFNVVMRQESHKDSFAYSGMDACEYCSRRLARQFVNNPDQLATVFVDGTRMSHVELSIVDPDDGVSKWKY